MNQSLKIYLTLWKKGSPVVFEIGYNQGEALKSIILNKFPDKKSTLLKI